MNFCLLRTDDEDDGDQQEKPANIGTESEVAQTKQSAAESNDNDEPMPEIKSNENLNNGSPEDGTESQKGNNDVDDNKELADGEIADMSGDESKAVDAPETIDLGKFKDI